MKTFYTLCVALVVPLVAMANPPFTRSGQTTVREFEVPQPPVMVREYVPVDRAVPQPPRKFREVTTTYVEEVDDTPLYLPARRVAPVAYAPAAQYAAPPVLATLPVAPVYGATLPVGSYRTGLLHLKKNFVYSDGSTMHYGPLGRPRGKTN